MEGTRTNLVCLIKNTKQKVLGSIAVELARDATPTRHELRYVWRNKNIGLVSGLFVRSLSVRQHERGNGYGSFLLSEAKSFAQRELLPLYIDVHSVRMDLRKWLRSFGFAESIFWHNSRETLMVRYRHY